MENFTCEDCIYRRTETTKYGKYARCKLQGRTEIFKAKEICQGKMKVIKSK